ncbi:hypothetical protein [Marinobacter sp. X15-166B]|uniref:hypothetical protein n=1 Tax=Marinobacter sp. X15-166B TaxID=1897620 RepID=UPI00085C51A2|nr:hypothetical protein [Marinobacter sp. X15-166B]OEY66121.1 hypothetical protein BG841_06375 [Marinobacter sp. X15-166B]
MSTYTALAAVFFSVVSVCASAQGFPERPSGLSVPYAAGGAADRPARSAFPDQSEITYPFLAAAPTDPVAMAIYASAGCAGAYGSGVGFQRGMQEPDAENKRWPDRVS